MAIKKVQGYALEIRVLHYERTTGNGDHADFKELKKIYIGSFAKSQKLAIRKYNKVREDSLNVAGEK